MVNNERKRLTLILYLMLVIAMGPRRMKDHDISQNKHLVLAFRCFFYGVLNSTFVGVLNANFGSINTVLGI